MSGDGGVREILLIEDSVADVRLIKESFKTCKVQHVFRVVSDGIEALRFLRAEGNYRSRTLPDLIILDLNLPKKDGREVLADIKSDPVFRKIPTIILTTSSDERDILKSYERHANCYITKPVGIDAFDEMMRRIETFWLETVKLPPK